MSYHQLSRPSFISLFVTHRIIKQHCGEINSHLPDLYLDALITSIKNINDRQVAQTILACLMSHGVKNFMKNVYHEKKHAKIIDIILNQIILTKFIQEYQNVTTIPLMTKININV